MTGPLTGYQKDWLRFDAAAGLTTAAVVIPKSMAFAIIAGLLILRTEGRMTFASAPRVSERMWDLVDEAQPTVVVLDCSAIPDFEYTALRTLIAGEEKLRERGIALWLASLNPLALTAVMNSPLGQTLGASRMFINLREAVQAYETKGATR